MVYVLCTHIDSAQQGQVIHIGRLGYLSRIHSATGILNDNSLGALLAGVGLLSGIFGVGVANTIGLRRPARASRRRDVKSEQSLFGALFLQSGDFLVNLDRDLGTRFLLASCLRVRASALRGKILGTSAHVRAVLCVSPISVRRGRGLLRLHGVLLARLSARGPSNLILQDCIFLSKGLVLILQLSGLKVCNTQLRDGRLPFLVESLESCFLDLGFPVSDVELIL